MWWGILLVVLAIGIGIALAIPRGKKIKQLREDGKIVLRNYRYAEKGEEFTSKVGTFEALKDQLEQAERLTSIHRILPQGFTKLILTSRRGSGFSILSLHDGRREDTDIQMTP